MPGCIRGYTAVVWRGMRRSQLAVFTDDAIEASLRSADVWHRDADLPDPLDRQDCRQRPDLVAVSVRRRIEESTPWGSPSAVNYPKIHGGDRCLVVLDPIAEIFYRQTVARVLSADRSLLDAVMHARIIEADTENWHVRPWRGEYRHLLDMRDNWRRQRLGIGELDIKDHYLTVALDSLARVLRSCGPGDYAVADLINSLKLLESLPGSPLGLPVGLEPSAVLGTLALLPIDRSLDRLCTHFYRWMDDISIPGISEAQHLDIIGVVSRQLVLQGQQLNPAKSKWTAGDLDVSPSYSVIHDKMMSGDEALNILEYAVTSGDYSKVHQALGVLAHSRDIRGLHKIIEHPILLHKTPARVGRLLKSVNFRTDAWEPILDLLYVEDHPYRAVVVSHLANAMPPQLLSGEDRERIFCMATDANDSGTFLLAAFLYALAFRSASGRTAVQMRRHAFELAHDLSDVNVRRSLIAGLSTGGTLPRRVKLQLSEFAKTVTELAYTAEWVLAA